MREPLYLAYCRRQLRRLRWQLRRLRWQLRMQAAGSNCSAVSLPSTIHEDFNMNGRSTLVVAAVSS